jgi:uncharacterized protein (DUF1697 family)
MTQIIAFLRGINVGGHCLVKKEKLQAAFVTLGFSNVSTYKQSGNVIFQTDLDPQVISERVQQELGKLLNCNVVVLLRTMRQLEEIVERNPFEKIPEEEASFLVTFMFDRPSKVPMPIKIPKSTAEIILIEGYEAYSVTRGHGDGGKPNPYIESKFKTRATTRNLNIIKEVVRISKSNKEK